jgi:hypothetical protein
VHFFQKHIKKILDELGRQQTAAVLMARVALNGKR